MGWQVYHSTASSCDASSSWKLTCDKGDSSTHDNEGNIFWHDRPQRQLLWWASWTKNMFPAWGLGWQMFSSPCWSSYSKSFWVVGGSTTLTHIHSTCASMMSKTNTALVRHPDMRWHAQPKYVGCHIKHTTKQNGFTKLMPSCKAAPQKRLLCNCQRISFERVRRSLPSKLFCCLVLARIVHRTLSGSWTKTAVFSRFFGTPLQYLNCMLVFKKP